MPARRPLATLLALAALTVPRIASAAPGTDPTGSRAVELVHGFWSLVSEVAGPQDGTQTPHPAPQAIPQAPDGQAPVRLDDLSKPTAVEAQLRSALRPHDGALRVTVANGLARLGD